MTHILLLAEGYSDSTGLKKFESEWHGRTYANGKAKLRVREVKLYTLAINECGKDEFLKDLKGLTNGCNASHDSSGEGFKWGRMVKWVRRISRMFGVTPIDDSKIEQTNIWYNPKNQHLASNAHFMVLGEVKDNTKDGVEQV